MDPMGSEHITIRLGWTLLRVLDRRRRATGEDRSTWIREAIRRRLEERR